jgi:flagellar motor switch protein FliM
MLTQAEIDALLTGTIEMEQPDSKTSVNLAELIGQSNAGIVKGKENEREIRAYNFWSPDRFSKEQMRAVELVHDDLSERLTNSLPTFLRTGLRPRVVHTEQGRFHDFLKDLPPASLYHLINLAPLPGQMVLTISPDVSYVILEQRLGGKSETDHLTRVMTEIDQALLRGMVEHMLNDIKAAWSTVVAIEPSLEDSTANQHWVQMVMGNERMMLITFELTIQGVAGTMNIYIPFTMLKPIANVLNPHVWISGRKENKTDPEARLHTYESLSQVTLPVRVYLGSTSLSVNDLLNLQPGQVLQLDTPVSQDLLVEVAEQARFRAKVGKVGNRLAAQITTTFEASCQAGLLI